MQLSGLPVSQAVADAYHAYSSAEISADAIRAWSAFRAACRAEQLDPVEVARCLNPWRKF
jgi:hypothetical protein